MFAVDTNILVWGVRKEPDPNRPEMVEKCSKLIADLHDRKITIMVPSVVLAEYLMGHTLEEQAEEFAIIGEHFFVAPFDAGAAAIAAQLYDKEVFDRIKASGVPRQCLKADYKVVATAIAHGAKRIYVDDDHFRTIANGRIIVDNVPALQLEMFGESEGEAT